MSLVEGSVTRLAGRREYVRVGLTAAFPAADTCQSSNRTLLKIRKLFTAKSLVPILWCVYGIGMGCRYPCCMDAKLRIAIRGPGFRQSLAE